MRQTTALLLALCLAMLTACAAPPDAFAPEGAAALTVVSGNTGERVTLHDKEEIRRISDNINALSYGRGRKTNGDGWSYSLQWCDEEGGVLAGLALAGDGLTVIREGRSCKGKEADHEIDLAALAGLFEREESVGPFLLLD